MPLNALPHDLLFTPDEHDRAWEIFANFSSSDKTQVWLAGHSQLQFYEDPITIDLVKPHLKLFFAMAKS